MLFRLLLAATTLWVLDSARPALALCSPDPDGDGYCLGFPRDCDNSATGAAIHPNALEDISNTIDEDCDGHGALQRNFVASGFPSFAWPGTGNVTRLVNGDVKVGNGTLAGSVSRSLSQTIGFGKVFIVVDVNAFSAGFGQHCEATVTTGGYPFGTPTTTATFNIFGTGTKVSGALAVGAAPRILQDVTLNCDAGRTMTVDWLSVQNTADVFPPTTDFSIAWDDVDAPAGGLNTTVVRTADNETLYAASDLGGVARWGPSDDTWVTINGEGSTGLTSQADLGVWDVLPVDAPDPDPDILYALTGRPFGDTSSWNKLALSGGLWRSEDDGGTWTRVAESHAAETGAYGVGGYGRYSGCTDATTGEPAKSYGGGKLLASEPTNTDLVYIANGDEDELGVALFDGSAVCELPVSGIALPGYPSSTTTPVDQGYVRALARLDTPTNGWPVLLVGYLGRGGSYDALYACVLPVDGSGNVDLACGGSTTAVCEAVDDALGLDIRDLELDPLDPSWVYLADGGRITGTSSCTAGEGGVHVVQVDDDGTDLTFTWDEVEQDFDDLSGSQETEVTGITVDPDGDYLFTFLPVTPDAIYGYDRMYRIATTDVLAFTAVAGDWIPINTGADDGGTEATDEGLREAGIANADPGVGWLYADTVARPDPYPARFAPGQSIDGVWVENTVGDLDFAVLSSTFNLWGVLGLDDPTGGWNPEDDTTWWVGPPADPTEPLTFQETVVRDIAEDRSGNLWMPVMDLGLLMLPLGGDAAERDCLWDNLNAGGAAVSVGMDDSVWIAFFDQDNSSQVPQELGIFRTLDHGTTWDYQGAGTATGQQRDGANLNEFRCEDNDTGYEADPMDPGATLTEPGTVFNDGLLSATNTSWGSPIQLAAINETAAIAAFQSYATSGGSADGKLALTLDGGATWVDVPFEGDWDADAVSSDPDDCTGAEFFDRPKSISFVKLGTDTVAEDLDSDGVEDGEWAMDFFVASRSGSDGTTGKADHCALARVQLSGDPAAPDAVWTWFELSRASSSTPDCSVDDGNILGVAVSPWSDEAWVYGAFTHTRDTVTPADTYAGGACVLDIDDPTSATQLVDPATHMYNIAEVAPNPWVSDLLLVVPQLDAAAWFECTELDSFSPYESLDCPDVPGPFLLDGRTGTWDEVPFGDLPPSLVGTAGAWTNLSRHQVLYGTEGAGAWRGTLSW